MVWEVKTQSVPQRVQEIQTQSSGMDEAFNLLKCNERLPSSPGCPSIESHMEYDDLPELQEVQDDQLTPGVFQVAPGVSHHEEGPVEGRSSRPEGNVSHTNWLTELANIATSPQSPLLQNAPHNRSSPVHIFSSSSSLHSYARPPLSSSSAPSPARSHMRERRRTRASSESESGIFCMSSLSDDDDLGWSHSWPSTAWHCFLKGKDTQIKCSRKLGNKTAADIVMADGLKKCGEQHLLLLQMQSSKRGKQACLRVTGGRKNVIFTFIGLDCVPPSSSESSSDSITYDFTPLDSSAVYVLSSMARQRRASQSSGGAVSPDCEKMDVLGSSHHSPSSKSQRSHASGSSGATPTKCKRPMNAFMLFAKKYRVEYTQMYPGKDNRSISVILGDKWKKMKNEERRMYTMEAKALAEEQKRLNPDCWKRKRTNSGSQQN
uniref:HMG-box transcription factor 1 n=1 Tax=Cyprinus carpio TaxID=7962 RepID=A0A8C1IK63_CYPCA